MSCRVIVSPKALEDFERLSAYDRARIRGLVRVTLKSKPAKGSKGQIKRLCGVRKPQYRLRTGDLRVFYDVLNDTVLVLAMVNKSNAMDWLGGKGELG
jgi:mRNA interferase RelE/StbE